MEILVKLKADVLEVYGDSMLVINHISEVYQCNNPISALYLATINKLVKCFKNVKFCHVSRENNCRANELAQVALGTNMDSGS